ncbi:hypothetical protein H9P43_008316 [Blastocladiella emersonii ATCC 22665]|nr:hypothetical protein H9P43_008316 [Blastocladiella emersonii ATCC 22665]
MASTAPATATATDDAPIRLGPLTPSATAAVLPGLLLLPSRGERHASNASAASAAAETFMTVNLDSDGGDASDLDLVAGGGGRARSPQKSVPRRLLQHLTGSRTPRPGPPPPLKQHDSKAGDDGLFATSADGPMSAAAHLPATAATDDTAPPAAREFKVKFPGPPPPPVPDARPSRTLARQVQAATAVLAPHRNWAAALEPKLLCGVPLRLGLGAYLCVSAVAYAVMLVDGINYLFPDTAQFAMLYNKDGAAVATTAASSSSHFIRGMTIAESVILCIAMVVALTCGIHALRKQSRPWWRVYVATAALHVLWNLVTSGLMLWAFPREFALAYSSAFTVLWLVASLVQVYAVLCSYTYLQVMPYRVEKPAPAAAAAVAV